MKLVVVTPAGRERYLRLLSHYVLGSSEVAEWQLWDNCSNAGDRAYLRQLANSDPRCRIKELAAADGGTEIIGKFLRFCDDPEALYLRLDDDIVFVEGDFFPRFKERAGEERGKALWFSPVIINNVVCAWFLKHFAAVRIDGRITSQAMCPWAWAHSALPKALHPVFIEAVRSGRIDQFRFPDQELRNSRFSINAYGFFGAEKMALGERFIPPDNDEEDWLSATLPAMENRCGRIFGDLAVAHFSYRFQERDLLKTDILEDYYGLVGLTPPRYRRSSKRWLKEIKRSWRPRREPRYHVSLVSPSERN